MIFFETAGRPLSPSDNRVYLSHDWTPCSDAKSLNDTFVSCILPPGVGKGLVVRLYSGHHANENMFLISYGGPEIVSVPPFDPESSLTVYGKNFGESESTVEMSIGNYWCEKRTMIVPHEVIECTSWSLVGTSEDSDVLELLVGSQRVNVRVNTGYPLLKRLITVNKAPTVGNSLVKAEGLGFSEQDQIVVFFEGQFGKKQASEVTFLSETEVSFKSPSRYGSAQITAQNDGSDMGGFLSYVYDKPVLFGVSPISSAATNGSGFILIEGRNFYGPNAPVSVELCDETSPIVEILSDDQIEAQIVVGQGTCSVFVIIADQKSNDILFSYDPPQIEKLLTHDNGALKTLDTFSVSGSNFGVDSSVIEVLLDGKPCGDVRLEEYHSLIVCGKPPPPQRPTVSVHVVVADQESNSVDVEYLYAISNISAPLPPQGGVDVTVAGFNLHYFNNGTAVLSETSIDLKEVDPYYVTFELPFGHGTKSLLLKSDNGYKTNTLILSYEAPVIQSVEAIIVDEVSAKSDSLMIVITASNLEVTGTQNTAVWVNEKPCGELNRLAKDQIECLIDDTKVADLDVQIDVGGQISQMYTVKSEDIVFEPMEDGETSISVSWLIIGGVIGFASLGFGTWVVVTKRWSWLLPRKNRSE
ncbi:hypothetical protein GEMRC1_013722 [Eukaryota sp. GEM-RC1]